MAPTLIFCVVVGEMLTVGKFMVRLVPLSVPVTAGLLLITLILYPVPVAVPEGIVALIVPELASLTVVPIGTGLENDPDELDNCAVYVFPLNVPTLVNGTLTDEPPEAIEQNGDPLIAPVAIVADTLI